MNDQSTQTQARPERQPSCRRHHGRRMVRAMLLLLALGLAAWPIWNWVAAPLLALPTLTYWQMTGIVALIASISTLFSFASRHRPRFRTDHATAASGWPRCGRTADNGQG